MLRCSSAGKYKQCRRCEHSKPHEILPVVEGGFCDVEGLCGHVPDIRVVCTAVHYGTGENIAQHAQAKMAEVSVVQGL